MSDIAPLSGPGPLSYQPSGRGDRAAAAYAPPSRGQDVSDISETARLLAKIADMPDVRQGLVERVRSEIAAGTYETPDKLDAAIEGLAQDLN